jgi:hypothetical protein
MGRYIIIVVSNIYILRRVDIFGETAHEGGGILAKSVKHHSGRRVVVCHV